MYHGFNVRLSLVLLLLSDVEIRALLKFLELCNPLFKRLLMCHILRLCTLLRVFAIDFYAKCVVDLDSFLVLESELIFLEL